ncbi:NADPH-dependent 3-keto-steroid reductase Hsd3b4-like isoform X2 [Haemaphysalis longicornis]
MHRSADSFIDTGRGVRDGGAERRSIRVVLVTGSSGFLGQHVIRHLQEEEHATLEEIRLFDSRPYEKKLVFESAKPKRMREYVGSICDAHILREALRGVDAVIHCASIVDIRFFADVNAMERVNVIGTKNVVESCIAENVAYLVYTGSVASLQEKQSTGVVHDHPVLKFYSAYGESKARAERIVLGANKRHLPNGLGQLRTLSIRLLPMYGELDEVFVTKVLRVSKMAWNTVFTVDCDIQGTYAGNAAAVIVRGMDALSQTTFSGLSGRCLVAVDDTPSDALSLVLRRVTQCRGLRMLPWAVPTFVLLVFSCIFWGIMLLLSPLFKVHTDAVPNPTEVMYVRQCPLYDGSELFKRLAWKPKYSAEQAINKSMEYYKNVKL